MSRVKKRTFSIAERVAIWRAWDKKCVYTGEPIAFRDLEIDHIIPEEMLHRPDEIQALRRRLNLANDFDLNSFANWVPTLHHANRQKAARQFTDAAVLYYLELARAKYPGVRREHDRLQREGRTEKHLTAVARLVDDGALTVEEVVDFLRLNVESGGRAGDGPLVITLGVGPEAFEGAVFYGPTCDALEEQLLESLQTRLAGFVAQTEASERSGESLSVRFAVWHAPLDAVLAAVDSKWDLLEVAQFSEIYPDADPADAYATAVAAKHRANVADPGDRVFGLGRCPECGRRSLQRTSATDARQDETYFAIKCAACGWGDWSQ
jgi:hypothetical protein